jgi:hypothetical protein
MPNVVYAYVIKSNEYNALNNTNTEYFGLTDMYINAKPNTQFYNKLLKDQKLKKEETILNDFIRRYDDYYFKQEDKHLYDRAIKLIDELVEDEADINNKRIIEKRKLKYIMVKTDKQLFLYNLAKKYTNSIILNWVGVVKDSIDKHKNDDCVIKSVTERYINDKKNKDKIIYHNIKKTTEEIKQDRLNSNKLWRKNNPEKHKEHQKKWKQKNNDKAVGYVKKCLYYKKLQPLTKEEVREIEEEIKNIIETNNKKDSIHLLCEMIIDNKQNHIIIKKVLKEIEYNELCKPISNRLTYLKK